MPGLRLQALIVFAGVLIAATGTAAGSELDFCKNGCYFIKVINNASVTVTKVYVRQKDKNGCSKVEKTNKADLSLGNSFKVRAQLRCEYHIKFVTTADCIGDKEADFPSQTNEPAPKDMAQLTGGCGTLRASKGYTAELIGNQINSL